MVVRGILLYGVLAGFCLFLAQLFLMRQIGFPELLFLIGLPLLAGGVLWVVAYILEGFLQPTR